MSNLLIAVIGGLSFFIFMFLLMFAILPFVAGFVEERRWHPWKLAHKSADYGHHVARSLKERRKPRL